MYSLTSNEILGVKEKIESALARLETERARRREFLRQQIRSAKHWNPALRQDLELMERTLAEIDAGPNAIIEEVVDAAAS